MNKLTPFFFIYLCIFFFLSTTYAQDTIAIRKTIDSIFENKKSAFKILSKDASLITSKISALKKYPVNNLQFYCYQILAEVKTKSGEHAEARFFIDTCFQVANSLKNNKHIAKAFFIEGIYYKHNGKSDAALKDWFKSLEISKKEKDASNEIACLSAIGREYADLKQYEKAELYAKQCIDKSIASNKLDNIASPYNLMANILTDTKHFDEAIVYFKKAESISQEKKDTVGLAYMNNNIGRVFYKKNDFKNAELHWKKSYDLFNKTPDAFGIAMVTNNVALIKINQKKYQEGIIFAKKAVDFSTKNDIQLELLRAHSNMMDAYYGLNDFKNGFKEYETIIDLKDAQFNSDMASAVADAEGKYKNKIQQDSITLLNNDKRIKELELVEEKSKTNQYKIILLITVLLIAIIGIAIYYILKNKRIKEKLHQQNQLNQAVLETEQQERERIARDLHDSVGQKLSVVKMQLSMKNSDTQIASNLLDDAIQDVRNVSHNLMPADLSNGLLIALQNLCEQINYSSTTLKIHLHKTEAINHLQLDKQHTLLIYRMVQELVNNAVKYAQAKNIHINMDCEKNQLKLNLTDDGIGFDINAIEQKDGLGIKSIKERLQQLIGTLQLSSNIGKGTQFNISIPV